MTRSLLFVRVCLLASGIGVGCTASIESDETPEASTTKPVKGTGPSMPTTTPGQGAAPSPGGAPMGATAVPGIPLAPGVMGGAGALPSTPRCQSAMVFPGPSPLRRLTRTEYNNTVMDLLGDSTAPAVTFPAEESVLGFDNSASLGGASGLLIEQYEQVAERLARRAAQDLPTLMGCRPANAADQDTCARQFVEGFGQRAFRRPLSRDEVDRHVAFYAANRTKYDFGTGVRMVLQAMLQAPSFIYRFEGSASATSPTAIVVKASPFDLASRLSYLFWSSMPDKALFDAANNGKLVTAADVAREGRRMLDDPRAKQGVKNFFGQWLEVAHVDTVTKDARTFPNWSPRLAGLMRRETETFIEEVVLRGDSSFSTLLRADFTFADKELATFYGAKGPAGTAFEKVSLDPTRRAGVLTQGAILASLAGPRQSSPVARGFFVRDRLLCAPPPPAPVNINVKPPEPDGRSTTRERFAQHRADPSCAGCHALMDPIGLGLESYDGIGQWRDKDAGRAIDTSGELKSTRDADGPFVGGVELGQRLAGSGQARECLARQYFRFAFGRGDQQEDACTIESLSLEPVAPPTTGGIRNLLVGLTQTSPFLLRTVEPGGAL